jgi:thiol-disulfide isomerase/thioredoxin
LLCCYDTGEGEEPYKEESMPARMRSRHQPVVRLGVLIALLCVFAAESAAAEPTLDLKGWLGQPGVKLVAVEFYATWCKPCMKAVPKWKKLHEKYRSRGLRLLVVAVQEQGMCASPNWNPDAVICDEDGALQEAWKADALPQAFLWSWQGNLLVSHGSVEQVEKSIENYFLAQPRLFVADPEDEEGKVFSKAKPLKRAIKIEFARSGKISVVPSKQELDELRKLRKDSHSASFADKTQCKLGEEMSPNVLVKSTVTSGGKKRLLVGLFSIENGCLIASSRAPIGWEGLQGAVTDSVGQLVRLLSGQVELPKPKSTPVQPPPVEEPRPIAAEPSPPAPESETPLPEAAPPQPLEEKAAPVAVVAAPQLPPPPPPPPPKMLDVDFGDTSKNALPVGWLGDSTSYVSDAAGVLALNATSAKQNTILVPIEGVPDNFEFEVDYKLNKACCSPLSFRLGNLTFGLHTNGRSWLDQAVFRLKKPARRRGAATTEHNWAEERTTLRVTKEGAVFKLFVQGKQVALARKDDFRPGPWVVINDEQPFDLFRIRLVPLGSSASVTDVRLWGRVAYSEDFKAVEEGTVPGGWEYAGTLAVKPGKMFRGRKGIAPFKNGPHKFKVRKIGYGTNYSVRFLLHNGSNCCSTLQFDVNGFKFGLHTNGKSHLGETIFSLDGALPWEKDFAVVDYVRKGEVHSLFVNGLRVSVTRAPVSSPTSSLAFAYGGDFFLDEVTVWTK